MDGVREVRVNHHAGSLTVQYDPDRLSRAQILDHLEEVGCLGAAIRTDGASTRIHELFGKALVGAVMQKAVERSAVRLVSVLL
jgi:hypothetical protein